MFWIRTILCIGLFTPVSALADELESRLASFNAHAKFPIPALTESQLDKLRQGKLVRIRQSSKEGDQPQRGIGLRILEQPRAQLWAGATDEHMGSKGTANEVQMPRAGSGSRWYQRLWLPWPFAHRHWVIDVQDTHALAKATGGLAWEHYWMLTPEGEGLALALIAEGKVEDVTSKMASGFVYTPVNRGAYFAIVLSEHRTLWGFHASTVVGGNISDRLIADFTMMQLKGVIQDVEERGLKSRSHYVKGHAPIIGGDGLPIPVFPGEN